MTDEEQKPLECAGVVLDKPPGNFPSHIAAFAFGGGGFKAVGCFWPVLYHLSKTHNIRALLHGNHIGAASGGGWFFSNLVFNREMWESLTSDKTEEEFLTVFRNFFEAILAELQSHRRPLGVIRQKVLAKCLGHSKLKGTLESQGFPLFDDAMLEWFNGYLSLPNGWKHLNDSLCRGQQTTPNADLELTCDLANGILTKATLSYQDNWVVDSMQFYKVKATEEEDAACSQIPMTINVRVSPERTTHTVTLCQPEQTILLEQCSKNLTDFSMCRCAHSAKAVEVTKDDIERGCQKAMQTPAELCGPTTCYFACFSSRFFTSYMGISNKVVKGLVTELEHKLLYSSFFGVDAIDEAGKPVFPLRMVDGGPWDHTGITMAVKGLQREGRSGDIVAITLYSLESYENFHCMFTDFDNKGDHRGIAEPPYARCFKGLPPTACAAYGKYLQVLDCEVETVDCPAFEIAGGRTYRLYYIFLMPEKLKIFPFKQESIDEYVAWCAQALKDLNLWSESLAHPAE
eukprot:CAMPEP_0179073092 /NCGR_PEP_ID=MMETSP0796-20121207/32392_1 /TAXON_ID=73915 /ORGANISM="Pyrodinium bahamense, Strain pbaha01" /LENGTH=514 /DNA_ID=CAMNT_0020770273 /DNA_START=36 /DNA_END=1580 /DNA_ORIENTATION=-